MKYSILHINGINNKCNNPNAHLFLNLCGLLYLLSDTRLSFKTNANTKPRFCDLSKNIYIILNMITNWSLSQDG